VPDNISLISGLLRDSYRIKAATRGIDALRIAHTPPPPDLILLDVMMSDMDGHEVCRQLKADPVTRDIPVVFLTALSDIADEQLGFDLGAVDYITKPISPPILKARVQAHLALKASADFLRDRSAFLESEVARRTREVSAIQDVTIQMMASLAETRDNETGNHIRRTQNYVRALALELRRDPQLAPGLDDAQVNLLFRSAPLHDIGKVGIPDRILLKPGRLEPAEFEIMKTHAKLGFDAIERAESTLGAPVDFLRLAKEIAYGHHEKWDGSGYPRGLSGTAIPLSARLMALADVFDALINRRVYKQPLPPEEARRIIVAGRGSHFDPQVVDAFIAIEDEFRAIAQRYADVEH
jgi:putative two-component system response regulator